MHYLIIIIICIVLSAPAYAHNFGGRERNTLKNELISERLAYDKCIKKAATDEFAKSVCRSNYALKRLLSLDELFHFYTEHAIDAEDIYTNLHIAVKGAVHRVGTSSLGFPEIIMALDAFGVTGVRFEFSKNMAKELEQLKQGTEITIGGIVKGMFTDNYVRLTHCEILERPKK